MGDGGARTHKKSTKEMLWLGMPPCTLNTEWISGYKQKKWLRWGENAQKLYAEHNNNDSSSSKKPAERGQKVELHESSFHPVYIIPDKRLRGMS